MGLGKKIKALVKIAFASDKNADKIFNKIDYLSDEHTTVGGSATETISIDEVTAADHAHVTINTVGAVPVTVLSAKCVAGGIEVVFSANPDDDHIVTYSVFKNA